MGLIAKLISFTRTTRNDAKVSDVTVDTGGGYNVTCENFQPSGDDAQPLAGDYTALSSETGSGRASIVGYVDTINEPKALVGEKRIYARDASGAVVVEVWLKNTGDAVVSNANGSVVLGEDGSSVITTPQCTFSALADGTIKGENVGSFELSSSGIFTVNGVTIDLAGNITNPATIQAATITGTTQVNAAGKPLSAHVHLAGTPPGNTGPVI